MTRAYKILSVVLALAAVSVLTLAISLSHNSPCGPAPSLPDKTTLMKAVVHRCYGSSDVLKVEDIEKPAAGDHEVLVRVHAASVNPLDWHYMRGSPYIVRLFETGFGKPKNPRLGVNFAGTVEAVGRGVTRFKPGDEVFGGKFGAFAEYVSVREDRALVLKPANVTFEQAASAPIAAITALQALRDKGGVHPGQKILINGASGGVGTFAVQLAKAFGAEVTGVCSTRNLAMVQSIGADHLIDYTHTDFSEQPQRYDLIVDTVGNHPLSQYRRVLNGAGILVLVGGPSDGQWIGPLSKFIKATIASPFGSQKLVPLLAELNQEDLGLLASLMNAGKLTPVIDRRYTLSEVPAAIRYLEEGHARGKVVIAVH